jgi:hypothetical protein
MHPSLSTSSLVRRITAVLTWSLIESYADSAQRLYIAAVVLEADGDPITAGHLFGVAAECALKATLQQANIRIDRSGGFRCHIPQLLQQILAQGATRHMVRILPTISSLVALGVEYSIDTRYAADASIDLTRCNVWRAETEAILLSCGFAI